jgi:chaperonin cofactor prefoldin
MSERRKIIQQLQERITKINEEIEKLIQDRYLHKCTIQELLKKSSEEDDSEEEGSVSDLSIKIITIRKQIKIIQVRE